MILYRLDESAVFCKVKDEYGGLSNMCGGYTIRMGETVVLTSEHLYQAFRFTEHPDIQRELLAIKSPMAAKMFSKKHINKTRSDWQSIKVPIMEWCLDLKLIHNPIKFRELLLSTGDRDIVEFSKKDDFWGAKPFKEGFIQGENRLGRLLWILRRRIEADLEPRDRPTVDIPDLRFLGWSATSLGIGKLGGLSDAIQAFGETRR